MTILNSLYSESVKGEVMDGTKVWRWADKFVKEDTIELYGINPDLTTNKYSSIAVYTNDENGLFCIAYYKYADSQFYIRNYNVTEDDAVFRNIATHDPCDSIKFCIYLKSKGVSNTCINKFMELVDEWR